MNDIFENEAVDLLKEVAMHFRADLGPWTSVEAIELLEKIEDFLEQTEGVVRSA